MATHTFGTNAASSLTAVTFLPGYNSGLLAADIATIAENIKHQGGAAGIIPGAFSAGGQLFLPGNRGVLRVLPGDVVAVDTTSGWPILVSKYAVANGPWTFT